MFGEHWTPAQNSNSILCARSRVNCQFLRGFWGVFCLAMYLCIDQTYKGFTWVQIWWSLITRKSTMGRPPVKIKTHSLVSNFHVDVINHNLCSASFLIHHNLEWIYIRIQNTLNILQRKESAVLHVDQNYNRFMKLFLWPLCPKTNILYIQQAGVW